MDSLEYLDDLIREYLLFRGFHGTLKALEADIKGDRLAHLDAERLTQVLLAHARTLDYVALQDTWGYLDRHVFAALSGSAADTAQARKMETALFRYFIVCAMQQGKPARVVEFLSTIDLAASASDWMTWSAITYVKKPAATPPFDVYFTKMWFDLFATSLRNFLERAFAAMPLPRLLNFNVERIQRKSLELENSKLRESVEYWRSQRAVAAPAAAMPAAPAVHPDDEPYLVLEECTVAVDDDTPRARIAVSRDGEWIAAAGEGDLVAKFWPTSKLPTTSAVRVVGSAPVAELLWWDSKKLVVVFANALRVVHCETKAAQEVALPLNQVAAAAMVVPPLPAHPWAVAASVQGVCVVNVRTTEVSGHAALPSDHPASERILHVILTAAPARYAVVCSASRIYVFEAPTLKLIHALTAPFAPLGCFGLPDHAVALISSRGQVATLSCRSGVVDPLLSYSLPGFPTTLSTPRACCLVAPPSDGTSSSSSSAVAVPVSSGSVATLASTHSSDTTGNGSAAAAPGQLQPSHLLVADLIYLVPAGRLVQNLRNGHSAAGRGGGGGDSGASIRSGNTGTGSRTGSASDLVLIGSESVGAAAASSRTGGGGSFSRDGSLANGGGDDRVTCVAWGRNVVAQGLASGAVRVFKLMLV
ncbi:hypothetical protein H9P43_005544 [Blastocladiella emersonii ATCC 22665]|nr:hypothetical protein H9P43_005544 [Blastocladiella emersonii ATCC 22665]